MLLATAGNNSAFGNQAANAITTGNNNCIFGGGAGQQITTGNSNTVIGFNANVTGSARSLCVVLGRAATSPAVDGSLSVGGAVGSGNEMTNLNVATAGAAAAGEFLNIYINGIQRKIALLLP